MKKAEIEEIRKNQKKDRRVYKLRTINDYRELVNYSVEKYSNNVAYKYKNKPSDKMIIEKTYKQVGNDIKALATAFLANGLKNAKIAVIGKNRYEWCITYLATTTGGMVIVPLDRALPENEINNLVKRSGVEVIVCDSSYVENLKRLRAAKESNLKTIISMDNIKDEEIEIWEDVVEQGRKELEKGNNEYEKVEIDPEEMSILLFTSGTTSEPKGVMLSQRNICTNIEDMSTYSKMYPTDTILSVLPIHHTFECTISFLYGFYSGVTIAFCDGLRYYADNLKEYEATIIVAVPLLLETIYKKIKNGIKEQGKEKTVEKAIKISKFLLKFHIDIRRKLFKQILDQLGGKVRILYYGAAQMDKETIEGYHNFGINSVQGYGLTETSPIITAESDKEHRAGSVGFIFPAINIRIDNPDKDGVGEIAVKGGNIMLGYYEDEKKTNEVLKDGWFSTGDFGYLDKDGFLYLTGRKNDIIVLRNGKNVYPEEIEILINKLPYVVESLVFSRESTKTDTLLCAKIVYDEKIIAKTFENCDDYQKAVWNDIKEINKELPTFKHIKKVFITTEPFEKTTTQKIKRNAELEKIKKENKK